MSDQQTPTEVEKDHALVESRIISGMAYRHWDDEGAQKESSLWLITFTDVMALMLTFFVLIYSMSTPDSEKWDEMTAATTAQPAEFSSARQKAGLLDVINIDKLDFSEALNLDYLQGVVQKVVDENDNLKGIVMIPQRDRLILSLPTELLFESGAADVNIRGKRALFALGGALSRIRNRIEVMGHADPRPISGQASGYSSNWGLSLGRAVSVAAVLRDVGYERPIVTRGLSSARYEELPADIPEQERLSYARRVDIVIMKDDGRYRFGGL